MQIIAEVKTHSPFGWRSSQTWDELFRVANEVGDIISIHTDPRWHGSLDLIVKARRLTEKPILAKGIHASDSDITKAIDAGANYVLVVGRIPGVHLDECFIEPNSLAELRTLDPEARVVWNSRDLETGGLKSETFVQARKLISGWLCQASNIKTLDDIEQTADAILIGEHLTDLYQDIKKFKKSTTK